LGPADSTRRVLQPTSDEQRLTVVGDPPAAFPRKLAQERELIKHVPIRPSWGIGSLQMPSRGAWS